MVNVKMTITQIKITKYVMMLLMFTFKINNLVVYLNRIGCVGWYGPLSVDHRSKKKHIHFLIGFPISIITMLLTNYELK